MVGQDAQPTGIEISHGGWGSRFLFDPTTYKKTFFMSKRYLITNLLGICKQHRIVLIGILIFIAGSQNVYPQQQIALDTYAIFQQSCLICHGPDGAYKESLLMEHNALIEKGSVVPGNPGASELYNRLIDY